MTTTGPAATTRTVYDLEGTLLEACSCGVLCPCWVGADPDGGLRRVQRLPLRRGTIRGVDVSGLSFINVVPHPRQRADAGQLAGGAASSTTGPRTSRWPGHPGRLPRAAGRAPGRPGRAGRRGRGRRAGADRPRDPRRGRHPAHRRGRVRRDGAVPQPPTAPTITTLRDSLFSTVPGSPAYVGRAHHHTVNLPEHGMVWSFEGRNAIQADYHIATRPRHDHRRHDPRAAPAPGRRAGGHRPGLGGRRGRPRHRPGRPASTTMPCWPTAPSAWPASAGTRCCGRDGGRHDAAVGRAPDPAVRRGVGPAPGRARQVLACFAGGYLAVWTLFGGAALVFDAGVHRLVHASPWLGAHPWMVAAPPRAGRRVPVLGAQGPLPGRLPAPGRLPPSPLPARARPPRSALGWGHGLCCLGLLLGADAGDVRRRGRRPAWMAAWPP